MTIELSFCKMVFSENYVICSINEGETITAEKSNLQTEVILDHYRDNPFIYITHRIHSYSVDPSIYSETSKIETLVGFVVVSSSKSSVKNALFEKMFLNKPFEIFEDIEDAVLWADTICNMKRELK